MRLILLSFIYQASGLRKIIGFQVNAQQIVGKVGYAAGDRGILAAAQYSSDLET